MRFKKGPGAALDASAAPASLALVDISQTVLMQHYDPEWAANLDPKVKESIRPLRYVGCAIRDPHEKAPESESAYGVDVKQAAVTDPTNNGPNGNVDLHFRMDVGPGSVTQALKDAAPASEEEPVIFELPPFTSKDHAGRFVLAFHKQATKEGLVHFRPPGGSMAVGTTDPFKPPSRPGSAPPPQTQPPTQAGSAAAAAAAAGAAAAEEPGPGAGASQGDADPPGRDVEQLEHVFIETEQPQTDYERFFRESRNKSAIASS